MDKHGIGTDATHADHIETIQKRNYTELNRDRRFLPTNLGNGLVSAYEALEIPLADHKLRSSLEKDLVKIENGAKQKSLVLQEQIEAYKEAFSKTKENLQRFYEILREFFGPGSNEQVVLPINNPVDSIALCPACRLPMGVNTIPSGIHVVSCTGYPDCLTSGYIPKGGYHKSRGTPCERGCEEGFFESEYYFPLGSVPRNGCNFIPKRAF